MKTLADGTQVASRTYYYLLDWNDQNSWKFIQENFGKMRLMDLTIDEYIKLWIEATKCDLENLKNGNGKMD